MNTPDATPIPPSRKVHPMSSAPWPVAAAPLHTARTPLRPVVPGICAPPVERRAPLWAQPIAPAPGMGTPNPHWWWLGAHGGAGVSTLTGLAALSADSHRAWPSGDPSQSPNVVLVCRTHLEGLERARDLLRQHTVGGLLPPVLQVLGLVTVPDAPGKAPPTVRRAMKLVGAAAPRVWHLPWIEDWRSAQLHEMPTWHPTAPAPTRTNRTQEVSVPPEHRSCFTALYELVQTPLRAPRRTPG